MDDRVIDINEYLAREEEDPGRGTFSLWGSDGGRVRFAMPVWRAISLLSGTRGGVVYGLGEVGELRVSPYFLLDLEEEPARTECPAEAVRPLLQKAPPAMAVTDGSAVAVLLGQEDVRRWFLVVLGVDAKQPVVGRTREHLLFLAGECAGLLFSRPPSDGTA